MLTFAEVVDHFRELERDPQCSERLDVLLDLSEVSSLPEATQIRDISYEVFLNHGEKTAHLFFFAVSIHDRLFAKGDLSQTRLFSFRRCRTAGRLLRFVMFLRGTAASGWLRGRLVAKQLSSHPTIPFFRLVTIILGITLTNRYYA
jgi:hypothetical protein